MLVLKHATQDFLWVKSMALAALLEITDKVTNDRNHTKFCAFLLNAEKG